MQSLLRKVVVLVVVAVVLVYAARAAEDEAKAEVGKPAPDFALKGIDGKEFRLLELSKESIVVLTWWSYKCPWSRGCDPYFNQLAKDYSKKGVVLLAIDSNKPAVDPVDGIRAYCKENKIIFPVLIDPGNKIADLYGAKQTPEVYVIDKKGIVRYHGAPDSRDEIKKAGDKDYVRAALDALLAGTEVEKTESKAFGCTIKRVQ